MGRVKREYKGFGLPYIAFFKNDDDEKLVILTPGLKDVIRSRFSISKEKVGKLPLDGYIDALAEGKDDLQIGLYTPITGVVEFSKTEMFPGVMDRLSRKYDIKRVLVKDRKVKW